MFKSFSKICVVIAMLIAFVGQAMANTSMSCEMTGETHTSQMVMNHEMMNHDQMNHSMMDISPAQNHEECCGDECVGPVSACSSMSIVSSLFNTNDLTRISENVTCQSSNQTKSTSSSLFRPPIFA